MARWSSATTSRPLTRSGSADTARRRLVPARGPLDGRAERGAAVERRLELAAAAGGVGIGHEHARAAPRLRADGGRADAPGQRDRRGVELVLGRADGALAGRGGRSGHERGHAARQRPDGGGRRGAHRLLGGGRVLGQQPHEAPAAALRLAGDGGLLLRVAVRRLGGDLVDVGEDRLAEVVEHLRGEARLAAGLDEAPPREARADAVGGQQGVEAAPGVELAAPEVDVDRPRAAAAARLRVLDQRQEALEGDLHAAPHGGPERPSIARA